METKSGWIKHGCWRETGSKDQEHDEKAAWPFSTEEIWLAMGRRSLI
jgi:hypothetical protein